MPETTNATLVQDVERTRTVADTVTEASTTRGRARPLLSSEGAAPRRPRRVLISADTYPPDVNGAAYFTRQLAQGLAARGHEVHVIAPSDTGAARADCVGGVTIHWQSSAPLLLHPRMRAAVPVRLARTAQNLVERLGPDIVHAQGHFTVSRATIRAARRAGVPVVATNHFLPENLLQFTPIPTRLHQKACDLAWRDLVRVFSRADVVTTPTRTAARLLARKGLARPAQARSCGIDLQRFQPCRRGRTHARKRLGLPDRRTLLFVGRLDEEKRLHEVVHALPQILRHVDAQLVFVGRGSQRHRLAELADTLLVRSRVQFLGFVPDDLLPLAYAAADVFVMPGVAELQSIATLEALACGLPVVAADALALPHLVHPDHNGLLYPPGDVTTLARHLTTLLGPGPMRARMGQASRQVATAHDHNLTLDSFEQIYADLANTAAQLAARVLAG